MSGKTKAQLQDVILERGIKILQLESLICALQVLLAESSELIYDMKTQARDFPWGESMKSRMEGMCAKLRDAVSGGEAEGGAK